MPVCKGYFLSVVSNATFLSSTAARTRGEKKKRKKERKEKERKRGANGFFKETTPQQKKWEIKKQTICRQTEQINTVLSQTIDILFYVLCSSVDDHSLENYESRRGVGSHINVRKTRMHFLLCNVSSYDCLSQKYQQQKHNNSMGW